MRQLTGVALAALAVVFLIASSVARDVGGILARPPAGSRPTGTPSRG